LIILPAIDIRMGKVVRLLQGDFTKETVYSGDPINMAVRWEREGAGMLHIVDLDGAYLGKLKNLTTVKDIANTVKIPIELGGGLRTEAEVDKALNCGINRVIIGTRAYKDEGFLKKMVKKYGDAIVVGIDAAKHNIISEGWKTQTSLTITDFLRKINDIGVKTIIYTDILKDGTMQGPNLDATKKLLDKTSADIIASGGVSSLDDVKAIKALNKSNLAGVIIGKALYEGKFTVKQANEVVQ